LASKAVTVWLANLYHGGGASPTGVLMESAATALQRAGHEVTVLSGNAAYNGSYCEPTERSTGRVRRLTTFPRQPRGLWGRLLSWGTYLASLSLFAFTHRLPDVVIVMTTPPYMHVPFLIRNALSLRKARLLLWSQDVYPEILAAVGILRWNSWTYRALLRLQGWATSRVHAALVLDEAMAHISRSHGAKMVHVVPNWDVDFDSTESERELHDLLKLLRETRRRFRFIILYTGNYSWGHDLSLVLRFLHQHPGQRDFCFAFVGGGEKWHELEHFQDLERLASVVLHPYIRRELVRSLIEQADIGLVTLQKRSLGLMSPSKIHGYLTQGKPLLYIGPRGSNVAEAIERFGCGWRIDEDDLAEFERTLDAISRGDQAGEWTSQAQRAARERYLEDAGTATFCRAIGS